MGNNVYISGFETYVGRGEQSLLGTGVPATKFQTQTSVGIKVNKSNQGVILANRKTRGKVLSIEDRYNVEGSVSGPLMPDELTTGIIWADLLGNNNAASGSDATAYTHTFSEPTAASHYATSGFTLETLLGGEGNDLQFDFIGVFLQSLKIDFPESGVVTFDTAYIGKDYATGGTIGSPSFTTKNPFVSSMVDIQIGASLGVCSSIEWKSGSFNMNNGAEMIAGGNSQTPQGVAYTNHMDVNVEWSMQAKDSITLIDYFLNKTEVAMKIVLTHTELAGTSSGVYKITINLPRGILLGDSPEISDEGTQEHKFNFEAMKECSAYNYTIEVECINSESGSYDVT